MKLTSKEEVEILNKRISSIEKKLEQSKKLQKIENLKKGKEIETSKPLYFDFENFISPP